MSMSVEGRETSHGRFCKSENLSVFCGVYCVVGLVEKLASKFSVVL